MFSVGLLGFVSDQIILRASRAALRWRALEAHG
jgi:ABC-type nitrate/sulfonate/bicarbonate transport system permease component